MPTPPTAAGPDPVADRCPGLLRPHTAADGALVRLRLPGGATTAAVLHDLAAASARYGDGDLHLTSRANLQVRGLPDDAAVDGLAEAARALGLLPSPRHERVRNIVCSPLSGLSGGRADVRGLPAEFDRLLRAAPELAALSGRFWFGFDDGRGDVAALGADLTAVALGDGRARIRIGALAGPVVPLSDAPATMIALARRFVTASGGAWRVADLTRSGRELGGTDDTIGAAPPPAPTPLLPGIHPGQTPTSGAVVALAPLGVVTAAMVAALPDGPVYLSTERMLAVPAGPDPGALVRRLVDTGFVTDPASPWTRVSACVGAPGCAKSHGDTHAVARALVARGLPDTPVHVVGCARGCGAPAHPHVLQVLPAPEPDPSGGS